MGLKRIAASDGEIYFLNEKGERVITGKEVAKSEINNDLSINALRSKVLLTTESILQDYAISKRIEIITAECVLGMNLFKDMLAGLSDAFGGRSETTQNALREAKDFVLKELRLEAMKVGANAVIGVDLDYNEFSGQGKSMLFLVASGTAVILVSKSE